MKGQQLDRMESALARIEKALDTVLLNQKIATAGEQTQKIVDGILAQRRELAKTITPEPLALGDDKPDPFGGVPAALVGQPDEQSGPESNWIGLPHWETGREPRIVYGKNPAAENPNSGYFRLRQFLKRHEANS
jgi:hypothetical protein